MNGMFELATCLLACYAAKRYDEIFSAVALMELVVLKPTIGAGMPENLFTCPLDALQRHMVTITVTRKLCSCHPFLPTRATRQRSIVAGEQDAVIRQAILAIRRTAGRAKGADNAGGNKRGLLFHEIVSFIFYSLVCRNIYREARARHRRPHCI